MQLIVGDDALLGVAPVISMKDIRPCNLQGGEMEKICTLILSSNRKVVSKITCAECGLAEPS